MADDGLDRAHSDVDRALPEARLAKVDEALRAAQANTSTLGSRRLMVVMVVGIVLTCLLVGFLVVSNVQLTRAVADKNETIEGVQDVLEKVELAEIRSQCFFTLLAERSLVTDPAVSRQMAVDYLEGRHCPEVRSPEQPAPSAP